MRKASQVLLLAALAIGLPSLAMAAPPAQPVYQWGGVNADVSSAPATVPEATFVLLATIPISGNRSAVEVQNQSAGTIQVVLDDGAATAGTISSILLSGGTANTGNGLWNSPNFKGRVRVYGVTGAQVMARQN